jgi:hypothetical protein
VVRHAITLVCVGLLAACSPSPAEPAPTTSAPTSTASTPDLVQAMDAKVKEALMPPGTYDAGYRSVEDEPRPWEKLALTDGKLSSVCLGARVDSGVSISRKRMWWTPLYVEQHLFGLVGVTGAHALDTVRAKAHSCQTYVGTINKPLREVKPDVELPGLEGADDSYAFCHSVPDMQDGGWFCEAFLVRGDLVVKVTVGATGEDPARSFLPDLALRAEQSLMRVG